MKGANLSMQIFFDTSAFAKRYIDEKNSDKVIELCQKAEMINLSHLCLPEYISAISRLLREKKFNHATYEILKTRFLLDIEDVNIYNIRDEIVLESLRLLERHKLRTLDALQLATAIHSKSELTITSDKQLYTAALSENLQCLLL